MCMLTFIPDGVQPDQEALHHGALWNDDGHGFAIADPVTDRLIVRRSMNADKLIEQFAKTRSSHPEGPAMFHSRWGTAGVRGKTNCHPFVVGNDPTTVVGHNGVLPQECQPKGGDPRCDTRIFAERLLWQRNIDKRKGLSRLSKWLRGDKLVILTMNPRYQQRAYIINENRGNWDHDTGIWYSNYDYLGVRHYYTVTSRAVTPGAWAGGLYGGSGSGTDGWTRTEFPCELCAAIGTVSKVTGICTACYSCQECHMDMGECLCYVPANRYKDAVDPRYEDVVTDDEQWDRYVASVIARHPILGDNNRAAILEGTADYAKEGDDE